MTITIHISRRSAGLLLLAALLACPAWVLAGPVTVPHTFLAGTPASAAQVNANFGALAAAVNDNDQRIGAVMQRVATLESAPPGSQGPKISTHELVTDHTGDGIVSALGFRSLTAGSWYRLSGQLKVRAPGNNTVEIRWTQGTEAVGRWQMNYGTSGGPIQIMTWPISWVFKSNGADVVCSALGFSAAGREIDGSGGFTHETTWVTLEELPGALETTVWD